MATDDSMYFAILKNTRTWYNEILTHAHEILLHLRYVLLFFLQENMAHVMLK